MAKFLKDDEINVALSNIIEDADDYILLISPFIKLHSRIKSMLEKKKNEPQVGIMVVFGKNEDNVEKSMNQDDFEYFKTFPNIEIRYNPRLHAKYFASEKSALLTSMNLYDFSQNNNIEFGIHLTSNKITDWTKSMFGEVSLDNQALAYFYTSVVEQSDVIFQKVPIFEDGKWFFSSAKYAHSEIEIDESVRYFRGETIVKKSGNFNRWKNTSNTPDVKPKQPQAPMGYCIRTKAIIPFNPKLPMSSDAYKSWSKFSNPDYPEKFCHFSGEPSNGETSFAKPILKKNWQMARQVHGI